MTKAELARAIVRGARLSTIRLLFGSALLMIRCKIRGVATCGVITSTRRGPRLVTSGDVNLGRRCAFRNERVASEVGAVRGGELSVGARTFINEGCTIVATSRISIGSDCRIGEFVGIFDTDYHAVGPRDSIRVAPVQIGSNVWIARGALVLPGVTIGDNSVVAGSAVVSHDVPPNTLVAGNPCRVVRSFDSIGDWTRE